MLPRHWHPNARTLIAAGVALVVVVLLTACTSCDASRLDARRAEPVAVLLGALPPPPTTTIAAVAREGSGHTAPRASRSGVGRTTQRPAPVALDAPFWRRLANCESSDGRSGRFLGYFQFSTDTARKVGWFVPKPTPPADRQWTYDEQVAMAQQWLGMIGGRGGSRAGWPVCWWRALR